MRADALFAEIADFQNVGEPVLYIMYQPDNNQPLPQSPFRLALFDQICKDIFFVGFL